MTREQLALASFLDNQIVMLGNVLSKSTDLPASVKEQLNNVIGCYTRALASLGVK